MTSQRFSSVAVMCFMVLLVTVAAGAKTFTLNGQAWEMWGYFGHDPIGALLSGHPHGLRYVVYYPIFATAELLNVSPDLLFSYVCAALFLLIAILTEKVIRDLSGEPYQWGLNAVIVFIFVMSALMNGRLALAFCGYLLIIVAGVDWFQRGRWQATHVFCLSTGCLLAGVSSGTLLVAMGLAGGIALITAAREPAALLRAWQLPLSLILIGLTFAMPAFIGIAKNLAFYGSDGLAPIRMLEHGLGGDIASSLGMPVSVEEAPLLSEPLLSGPLGQVAQFWWAGVIAVALFALALGWRPVAMVRSAAPEENVIHFAVALAILGGFFGYSVLMMGLIPFLIFVVGYIGPASEHMLRMGKSQ